jgi:spore maturation protein CgeB
VRILFVASLHHPPQGNGGRRVDEPGDLLFPVSQAHAFWVKALRAAGHECAVFWRSASAYPWARQRPLRMTERLTFGRTLSAAAGLVPRLSPDLRLRNRELLRRCAEARPDVLIVVGGNTVVFPETLAAIRAAGSTVVYTCGTSPVVFSHALERAAAPLYDLVVANDRYHAVQWRELGARRAEVLPMSAVDPDVHRPYELTAAQRDAYGCDVGFVGTLVPQRLYSERVAALEALVDLELKIWSVHEVPSSLRDKARGPLLGEPMLRALCGARIVVNPHGDFMRWGGNMRLFEACGVGAFQIVDDRPGVSEWFTPGEHLVTYRDPAQLRELVAHFLDLDQERERIARAGREHVLAHHTYAHRMAALVRLVEEVRTQRSGPGAPGTVR